MWRRDWCVFLLHLFLDHYGRNGSFWLRLWLNVNSSRDRDGLYDILEPYIVTVGFLSSSLSRRLVALAFAAEEVGGGAAIEVFADAAGLEFVVAGLLHDVKFEFCAVFFY